MTEPASDGSSTRRWSCGWSGARPRHEPTGASTPSPSRTRGGVRRPRWRLVLAGVTRARVAGDESCVAPVEWLRREFGVPERAAAPLTCRVGGATVGVRTVEAEPFPTA